MGYIIFSLVVAGLLVVGVVRTDVGTERAYGLLALTLLALIALGYIWPPIIEAIARGDFLGTDDLVATFLIGIEVAATILAIALPVIVGLIEMAVTNTWRWFSGLLAASAVVALVPLVIAPPLQVELSWLNPRLLNFALLVASEAAVLLVCTGYGIRATWVRSVPAR